MKKIIFSLLILTYVNISCDSDFEEVNTNPNSPTDVSAHLFLGNVLRVNQNLVYDTFVGCDMGMCWSQQMSKVVYNDEERYLPRQTTIDNFWSGMYSTVLLDADTMEKFAQNEGNTNLQAIAKVLKANSFQILTDTYGPIIFSEFNSGNDKPKLDSEDLVYNGLNQMLIDADALFQLNNGTVPATSDLLYGGNISKWRKFANSLRLKVLMRMAKKVNVNAQISTLVNSGNLMQSNADSAQLIYKTTQPDANPIYETIVYGARPEFKVSTVLVDIMNNLDDERLTVFANPVGANYIGNIPGVENQGAIASISGLGSFYLRPELSGVFLSYAQVELFVAEAYNEGYVTSSSDIPSAVNHYRKGVSASFEYNGLTVTQDYLDSAQVNFSTQVQGREKIATQMWLALFGQGVESWTEWRRTGFPLLSPVQNAYETSIPKRYYYHSNEKSVNNSNYLSAVALLSNGDKLSSPVWWME